MGDGSDDDNDGMLGGGTAVGAFPSLSDSDSSNGSGSDSDDSLDLATIPVQGKASKVAPEVEEGGIEYKWRLKNPSKGTTLCAWREHKPHPLTHILPPRLMQSE